MSFESIEGNKIYESLKEQALESNDKSFAIWCKYKNDLDITKSILSLIPKKVTHKVMIPIGPKALLPGKIVHSNEFLVNLGETWFVKRTGSQAIEICDRRIKTCDEMLEKLKKEKELLINKSSLPVEEEAFGNLERPEIIEYVSEEEDFEWKKRHKVKEREYRQKLAELRNKEKKVIVNEEDLWKHLDELELQEELEDELNRLNAEIPSDEESKNITELFNVPGQSLEEGNIDFKKDLEKSKCIQPEAENNRKVKRRVSFACNTNLSEEDPLRLEIKHSDIEPNISDSLTTDINSPRDIYLSYVNRNNKTPISVLKNEVNPNKDIELQCILNSDEESDSSRDDSCDEIDSSLMSGVQFKDVVERHSVPVNNFSKSQGEPKKISKFKAMKNKMP